MTKLPPTIIMAYEARELNHGWFFLAGVLTTVIVIGIACAIDPLISAHAWCLVTQSERCF